MIHAPLVLVQFILDFFASNMVAIFPNQMQPTCLGGWRAEEQRQTLKLGTRMHIGALGPERTSSMPLILYWSHEHVSPSTDGGPLMHSRFWVRLVWIRFQSTWVSILSFSFLNGKEYFESGLISEVLATRSPDLWLLCHLQGSDSGRNLEVHWPWPPPLPLSLGLGDLS